jgi:hypothetical protein
VLKLVLGIVLGAFLGFIWKDDVAARTESPGHEVALSRLTSKLDSSLTMHMIN